jgi:hypothetical protein
MRGIVRRYAIVRGARSGDEIRAYLPSGYRLDGVAFENGVASWDTQREVYVISGVDDAGWTLHEYVGPRLASGSMGWEEIDLSHPVMKQIEVDRLARHDG